MTARVGVAQKLPRSIAVAESLIGRSRCIGGSLIFRVPGE
jgi:hypothetical protein